MPIKLFVTGTDTNVGKTFISVGLLNAFNQLGKSTLGIKPVASGGGDAIALKMAASIKLDDEKINPFAFIPPIAPHIAARQAQTELSVSLLNQKMQFALEYPADVCVIEGAGGWLVPLNDTETMADFVKSNQFNVLLVVGMRLGCINHTLLTMRALQADNINVIGWIANSIDPDMAYREESIMALQQRISVPCLGVIGHMENPEHAINIKLLETSKSYKEDTGDNDDRYQYAKF